MALGSEDASESEDGREHSGDAVVERECLAGIECVTRDGKAARRITHAIT